YPIAQELDLDNWHRLGFMLVLVNAAYVIGSTRRHLVIALSLAAPAVLLQGAAIGAESVHVDLVATIATLLCFLYVTFVCLVRVLEPGNISMDRLIGAACVFLLMGLVWTMIFAIQLFFEPGALEGLSAEARYSDELVYFSFVTLTTLGFGEITPATPMTRTTVWMEAVAGQLYLAILVARLVGLPMASPRRSDAPDES
ncbi:MAG: potassium channel family protein, partial [Thermoanaerobaculia bacterium]|nr:potassium channel family protein [Thermoanaerobaculia bacterium]